MHDGVVDSINSEVRLFVEKCAVELGHPRVITGFADLSLIPEYSAREVPYPNAVSIAVPLDPAAVASIRQGPTREYYLDHQHLGEVMAHLEEALKDFLIQKSYGALVLTQKLYSAEGQCYSDAVYHPINHRLIAVHAGMGWVGKNGLLITKHFGPAVRITSVLTDAPVECSQEVFLSRCGRCTECAKACPAGAIPEEDSNYNLPRKELVDLDACQKACRDQCIANFGVDTNICGLCIFACPYTESYLSRNGLTSF